MKKTVQEITRESQTVTTRDRWEHPDHGDYYVVGIGIEDEGGGVRVGLQGPGPCRGYRTVDIDEFLREWTKLAERS